MLSSDYLVRKEDLVNNPTARVPVCLCLDISCSMDGDPIEELNKGVELFYEAIREDETALYSAEISVVTFGHNGACLHQDFDSVERQQIPHFTAGGMTPMGEAINIALDCLEQRKQEYQDAGVDYYQPWLVVMTDGLPNGDASTLSIAVSRTAGMVNERKLTVFPIGIGAGADMGILRQLSPKRPPLRLKGLKFREFFAWLSQSVSRTSQSTPGEAVPLDVDGIQGWGEL